MDKSILQSNVNGLLSLVFVGVFALGALLVVCQNVFGENPVEHAMAAYIMAETQLP
jgi:hypothetical protein